MLFCYFHQTLPNNIVDAEIITLTQLLHNVLKTFLPEKVTFLLRYRNITVFTGLLVLFNRYKMAYNKSS